MLEPASVAHIALLLEETEMSRLIVVGGDGLVHHAIQVIAADQRADPVVLGIVPSGTGNDLARSLGVPRRRRRAVEVAVGATEPLDLMRVTFADGSQRLAVTVVTGGFSGRVTKRANALTFPKGQQKYTVATLLELGRLTPFDLTVSADGTVDDGDHPVRFEHPTSFFAVGNTPHFGGGMAICPGADPTDGILDVTVVGEISRATMARVLPTVFFGRHIRRPEVHQLTGRSIHLDHAQDVWADGEPIGVGEITIEVVPSVIRVARPRPA